MIYRYRMDELVIEISGELCPPDKEIEIFLDRIFTEFYVQYHGCGGKPYYTKELVLNRTSKGGEIQKS